MREAPRPDLLAVMTYYGCELPKRYGSGWVKTRCVHPDHPERNPSCTVNLDAGKWFCHGCGQHGDALDLIAAYEGTTGNYAATLQAAERFAGAGDGSVRESTGARNRRVGLLDGDTRHRSPYGPGHAPRSSRRGLV